jgi:hypothetical protein
MKKVENPMENPTIKEVFDSMNNNQKDVLYAIVGYVAEIEKRKTKQWRDRYLKKVSEAARWQKLYECARLQLNKED